MANIRQILADNMKINRQKRGFSQVKMAEQANVTPQYIAMIEVCNKFPKPEMLERLAKALEIEPHELFIVPPTPQDEMEQLRKDISGEIKHLVEKAIKETLTNECKIRELSQR